MSEQRWYKVCYKTWALPVPGAGVIVRHCVYRYVQTIGDTIEVPEGTALVFVPGVALRMVAASDNTEVQVVTPGPAEQRYVGAVMPGVPTGAPEGSGAGAP